MRRIEPHFPLSHRVPQVDDRRIISGIIFVIRNALRWRDAPAAYCPPKTINNRFNINRQIEGLEAMQTNPDRERPFLWPQGQSLADALAHARLSLDDRPLFAMELMGSGGHCPLHERDRHLLDA